MKNLTQSEDWNCGIYSIYHSCIHLEIPFDPILESRLFKRLVPKEWGLGPGDILKILEKKNIGYEELICASNENEKVWLRKLRNKLKKGFPIILLTRDWGHWVTLLEYRDSFYYVANSENSSGRVGKWSEKWLLSNAKNPGKGLVRQALVKVHGIDNLYAISVEN